MRYELSFSKGCAGILTDSHVGNPTEEHQREPGREGGVTTKANDEGGCQEEAREAG